MKDNDRQRATCLFTIERFKDNGLYNAKKGNEGKERTASIKV